MDDAPLRVALVEHAVTHVIAIEDRRYARRQIRLDNERIRGPGRRGDLQSAPYQCVAEGPIHRKFDRDIPVRRTARAGVTTAVIGMKTEREHTLRTH
jgi:hypothetical protein